MNFSLERSFAEQQDRADALAKLRDEFRLPTRADGEPAVYLCGHSLGLQPKAVATIVQQELDSWAQRAVDGHFESERPWLSYHERFTPSLARLVGAQPLEVVAMNTLTVNLHLMLTTFYRPTRERSKIVIEKHAFSSDRYAVASQVRSHGLDPNSAMIEIGPRPGEEAVRTEDVLALIEREGAQIATVMLPGRFRRRFCSLVPLQISERRSGRRRRLLRPRASRSRLQPRAARWLVGPRQGQSLPDAA
jgi:kynureninase